MKFSEIASRLNSVGVPFFTVGWIPKKADVAIAKKVIRFLEDRRMLFNACACEDPGHCALSAIEIRKFMTDELSEVTEGSDLYKHLAAIRSACRSFLDNTPASGQDLDFQDRYSMQTLQFFMSLGELRATVGHHVALMAVKWEIDVEKDLAQVLPKA
ncbi:DUF6650 family protein [Granulicella sp. dw_53]|uniref:DUF6650 family protein n=1 Tax=Granulicella sp. dw_53 TaxID=2719792 RepID=UPI001BD4D505|nr:DUF6650 family protein [Granulicella sp. dw_53]